MITWRNVAATPGMAHAQAPSANRPVRFIVPWPPGGLNDLVARAFNDPVSRALGQPIVHDLRAGAGGRIGAAEVARAAPDGYTIGMGNLGPLTIFPHLFRDIRYDAGRDPASIVMFAAAPLVLVVSNDVPARNVAEFIAWVKSQPGRGNYASVGIGTAQHLILGMFRGRDGIAMEHVPFRGTNESLPAMLRGDIHAILDTLRLMRAPVQQGQVRALAVTPPTRVPPVAGRAHAEGTGLRHRCRHRVWRDHACRDAAARARWGQVITAQGIKVE